MLERDEAEGPADPNEIAEAARSLVRVPRSSPDQLLPLERLRARSRWRRSPRIRSGSWASRWAEIISTGTSQTVARSSSGRRRRTCSGHHRVEQDQVRLTRRARARRALEHLDGRRSRSDHLVAVHLEPALEHQQHRLGIVGDQELGHERTPCRAGLRPRCRAGFGPAGRPSLAIGSTKRKVAPSPGWSSAEIAPPCSSTSDLAIASRARSLRPPASRRSGPARSARRHGRAPRVPAPVRHRRP